MECVYNIISGTVDNSLGICKSELYDDLHHDIHDENYLCTLCRKYAAPNSDKLLLQPAPKYINDAFEQLIQIRNTIDKSSIIKIRIDQSIKLRVVQKLQELLTYLMEIIATPDLKTMQKLSDENKLLSALLNKYLFRNSVII
jgi:hypothetical protein